MSLSKDCSTNIDPFLKTTEKTEEKSSRFPPITTRGSRGRPKKSSLEFSRNDVFNETFEEKHRRFSPIRIVISRQSTIQSDSLGKFSISIISTNISHALDSNGTNLHFRSNPNHSNESVSKVGDTCALRALNRSKSSGDIFNSNRKIVSMKNSSRFEEDLRKTSFGNASIGFEFRWWAKGNSSRGRLFNSNG